MVCFIVSLFLLTGTDQLPWLPGLVALFSFEMEGGG